jgi:hypothetical protein
VSGVAFTIGLHADLARAVKAYFDKFTVLPPRSLSVGSTKALTGPASFETLVSAVAASSADRFVIVVHGHEDGSGLFLPLANRGRLPVGARTTHDKLQRLRTIAARTPAHIDDPDRQTLQLRDAEIQRLIALMKTLQAKHIQAVEFRGCNLGRNVHSVAHFRSFFGAASFGAPNLHSFFGRDPVGTGANLMRTHAQSHQGTTYTYTQTFGGKTCHCCIGVNDKSKPQNGHIVADDLPTVDLWIQANLQAGATLGSARMLPIHGLWELPTIDLDHPDILADPKPRPIFPLATNAQGHNEYQQHIVYSP